MGYTGVYKKCPKCGGLMIDMTGSEKKGLWVCDDGACDASEEEDE
jgi:hypothetical protein